MQARRIARSHLGTLKSNTLSASIRKRYDTQLKAFFDFLDDEGEELPDEYWRLDELLCLFIEFLWEEGLPKAHAGDAISAVSRFVSGAKRHLGESWRLKSKWDQLELPNRATPIMARLVGAMIGYELSRKRHRMAAALALAYHCLLRTGELVSVRFCNLEFSDGGSSGFVFLGYTKGGKRRNMEEKVEITDPNVVLLLHLAAERCHPTDRLVEGEMAAFRKHFDDIVAAFYLDGLGYKPYSLRRGGTTHHFRQCQSLDNTVLRGRWANVKTARLYIDSANQELKHIRLGQTTKKMIDRYFMVFKSAVQ